MDLVYFILTLFFSGSPIFADEEKGKLVFVYTQFRHGARGPAYGFNENGTDYFGQEWKNPQDLTAVGMRMHYTLGIRNRKRFQGLLSDIFDPREVIVKSTNFNRTIQSAYAQLQGLYSPLENADIDEKMETKMKELNNYTKELEDYIQKNISTMNKFSLPDKMQIFPIHIYNVIDHKFLLHTEESLSGCKGVMPIRAQNRKGEKYNEVIKNLTEAEGEPMKKIFNGTKLDLTNGTDLFNICDQFICDLYDGRVNKTNVSETFEESCQIFLSKLLFSEEFGDEKNEVLDMSMSPVFEELLYYMNNSIVNDITNEGKQKLGIYTPKLVMISGHDVSMMGMMEYLKNAFNIEKEIPIVPFATSLSLEVYKKGETKSAKDYTIHYYINDDEIATFSFEDFNSTKIRDKIWSEDKIGNFCEFADLKEENTLNTLLYVTLGLSGLAIVLVLTLIIIIVIMKVKIKNKINVNEGNGNEQGLLPNKN